MPQRVKFNLTNFFAKSIPSFLYLSFKEINANPFVGKEFPEEIKSIKIYWQCEIDKIIEADDVFRTQIYPNLRFFHRLSPRDAIVGGYRLLKKVKWDAEKDVNTKLLFLDINGNSSANSKLKTGMVPY